MPRALAVFCLIQRRSSSSDLAGTFHWRHSATLPLPPPESVTKLVLTSALLHSLGNGQHLFIKLVVKLADRQKGDVKTERPSLFDRLAIFRLAPPLLQDAAFATIAAHSNRHILNQLPIPPRLFHLYFPPLPITPPISPAQTKEKAGKVRRFFKKFTSK